jgi:protein-disulfide isomerase
MRILALLLAALAPCLAAGPDVDKSRSMGDPAAPILFEVYSDFSCPACKRLHDFTLPTIIQEYVRTGKAFLVFREFPLDIPAHKYSRPAAALAVAAARIGKYQTVSDALFRDQGAWGASGNVWDIVAAVLSPEERKRVQALAGESSVLAEVQHDVDRGKQAMVSQTPTLMVTYKLRQQPWTQFADLGLFRGYIDALLKK